jgi:hypothetical protein
MNPNNNPLFEASTSNEANENHSVNQSLFEENPINSPSVEINTDSAPLTNINTENIPLADMHLVLNKVVALLRKYLNYDKVEIYGSTVNNFAKITFPECVFIHTCDIHGVITATHVVLDDALKTDLQKEINSYIYPSITVDNPNIYSMYHHTVAAYHKQVEEEINLMLDTSDAGGPPKVTIEGIYNMPQHFTFALVHKIFLPIIKQSNLHYHVFTDRHIEKC